MKESPLSTGAIEEPPLLLCCPAMEEPPLPMDGAAMDEPTSPLFAADEVINLAVHQAPGGVAEEVVASSMVAEHVGYPTFGQEDDEAVMDHGLEGEKKEQVQREYRASR
jgi:hypothetical protein